MNIFFVLETFQLCPLFLFSPQTLFGSQLVKQFPESRERFRFGLGIACLHDQWRSGGHMPGLNSQFQNHTRATLFW
jgi:hypothetical protein